jgi:two-component system, NarL family, sensor kinase
LSRPAATRDGPLTDVASAGVVDSERRIAWLRAPAIGLVASAQAVPHSGGSTAGVAAAAAVGLIYAAGAIAWTYTRPVTRELIAAATAADVVVVTVIVGLAGGAFGPAWWGLAFAPVLASFRLQPVLCAGAGSAAVVAFLAQALVDAGGHSDAGRIVALRAGVLLWVTAAATLLSLMLGRRTERVGELVTARQRLLGEALTAEERERRALAEGLHDEAIQNLLSARQDLAEAEATSPHPAVQRADAAIRTTVRQLREAIFRLHPSIREEAGLEEALRAIGEDAARRGRFRLELDVRDGHGHAHERLLLGAARELLANAAEHAHAHRVALRVHQEGHELVLAVSDDGRGFDPRAARDRVASGHIGLASQRARAESIGGRLTVSSRPGRGTTVEVRVPA